MMFKSCPLPSWRLLVPALVMPALLFGGAVLGQSTPPPAAAPAVADPTASDEWILDEERGLKYRISAIPKIEGAYRWLDEKRVRMPGGAFFEVVRHDAKNFWVKEYYQPPPKRVKKVVQGPSEEELAAAAKTYESDLKKIDRLNLEEFDAGLPRRGQWRNGFDIADMNGDGHLDIVFGPARKSRPLPNIFLGDGEGNWTGWRDVVYPPLPYDYGDAAAGDLNGDGLLDLVFGIHLRGVVALIQKTPGVFEAWTTGIEVDHPGAGGDATSFSSRAVEVVDWNGDGQADILALGEGPKGRKFTNQKAGGLISSSRGYLVYQNLGDGTWEATRPTAEDELARFDFGDGFAMADFNGDQHPDLVTASRRMSNRAILNLSDGQGELRAQELSPIRPRAFISAVAAGDFDGDGRSELVLGYVSRELKIWRSGIDIYRVDEDGEGWQRTALASHLGRNEFSSFATGDFDGDAKQDLVALNGEGEVMIFLGDGGGGFQLEVSPEFPQPAIGCTGWLARLTDLDGDGTDELIAGFAGEPTGLPGMGALYQPGCPQQGSLRVWRSVAADAP